MQFIFLLSDKITFYIGLEIKQVKASTNEDFAQHCAIYFFSFVEHEIILYTTSDNKKYNRSQSDRPIASWFVKFFMSFNLFHLHNNFCGRQFASLNKSFWISTFERIFVHFSVRAAKKQTRNIVHAGAHIQSLHMWCHVR